MTIVASDVDFEAAIKTTFSALEDEKRNKRVLTRGCDLRSFISSFYWCEIDPLTKYVYASNLYNT